MITNSRSIDAATLRERLENHDVRLLDVRTPSEFETAHIPGSSNVRSPPRAPRRADPPPGRRAVLICRSGARAGQAEQTLAGGGLPGLRVLEGGMTAWEASGARSTAAGRPGNSSARSASWPGARRHQRRRVDLGTPDEVAGRRRRHRSGRRSPHQHLRDGRRALPLRETVAARTSTCARSPGGPAVDEGAALATTSSNRDGRATSHLGEGGAD